MILEGDADVTGAVEGTVADGFGDVARFDGGGDGLVDGEAGGGGLQVGDGTGYAQDAVEGSGRHVELGHAVFKLGEAGAVGPGEQAQHLGSHLDVGHIVEFHRLDFDLYICTVGDFGSPFSFEIFICRRNDLPIRLPTREFPHRRYHK